MDIKFEWEPLGHHEDETAHIPLRNLFLLMRGALYKEHVCLVAQKGERNIPDRSAEFFKQATEMLTIASGQPITCDPVFAEMTKTDMVRWYLKTGLNPEILNISVSCYSGKEMHQCGACSSCFRRWVAFILNDLEDPFLNGLMTWEGTSVYYAKASQGTYYEDFRNKEILAALDKVGWTP